VTRGGGPMTEIQKAVYRIRKDTGIDFVFHDLRRTAASYMTAIGVSRLVVSKVLNHVERGITAVYDRHSYDADKRRAIIRWERKLTDILEGRRKERRGDIVEIKRASAQSLDVGNA
ncbi:MAG: tyrosine-type recombinase/integrase, partial [Candidatus Binatia bacterium]